jgi:hypothetical protein
VKYQYFAIDALPQGIQETFDSLRDELDAWVTPENVAKWSDFEVLLEFESKLTGLQPVTQIRYLTCLLTKEGGEIYLAAGALLSTNFLNFYFSWLAVRLTEALCAYVGSNLLRSNQERLEARWAQASRNRLLFRISNRKADDLLHFLFTTLVPQASMLVGKAQAVTVGDVTNQFTRDSQQPQPKRHTPTTLPQTLESLCLPPFTPLDLRKLLTELGVLDTDTGRWHLGKLVSKAASPKSAFPAAYRSLVEARLLLQTDTPIYRQIFEKEFGVELGDRTANYKEGKGSTAFHDYLNRARYWIKIWKSKL